LLQRGADVDVLNKTKKTATGLATENGQAKVAKFIADYKTDGNSQNKIRSTTYGVDEDGKDEGKAELHAAVEKGDTDLVESLLE
jgi:ankyrin repeat protein